jgi:hypothetical protein
VTREEKYNEWKKAGCPQGPDDCSECGEPVNPNHAAYHEIAGGVSRMIHLKCGDTANEKTFRCEECDEIVRVGDWPYCPHGKAQRAHGFEPYFDYGLGKYITGRGDVHQACRPRWENDYIVSPKEL